MKVVLVENKESKSSLAFKMLLGGLVLAIAVGLGNTVQARDSTTDTLLFSQMGFFDPFTLKTIIPTTKSSPGPSNVPFTGAQNQLVLTTESSPGPSNVPFTGAQNQLVLTTESSPGPSPAILGGLEDPIYRPPIRIPFRPVLRSPYRPPLP